MVKSSRLYEELKTFVWKNGKAQAQKGQNDDLIMALAIGIWLYDTSPHLSKHGTDLNAAMLAAFGVNSTSIGDTVLEQNPTHTEEVGKPGKRKKWPNSKNPYTDFGWMLK